jgi:hypothetical protein
MNSHAIHLVYRADEGMWHLTSEGTSIAAYNTKADGVVAGQLHGRSLENEGVNVRFVIHREDGTIDLEHCYGREQGSIAPDAGRIDVSDP